MKESTWMSKLMLKFYAIKSLGLKIWMVWRRKVNKNKMRGIDKNKIDMYSIYLLFLFKGLKLS